MDKTGCIILVLAWIALSSGRSNLSAQETLSDAWNVAVTASRQIQAENRTIESQRYQEEAITARRVPRFTAESSYTVLSEQVNANVDVSSLTGRESTLVVPALDQEFGTSSINVTIPLYLGGKIAAFEKAQNLTTQAATYQRTAVISQIRLEVTQAYFGVLRMEKIKLIAEATKKSLDNRLKDTQSLLEQGVTTQTAFLSVKVAQANAEQMVYESNFGLRTARSTYNRLLWRSMDADVQITEIALPTSQPDVETLTQLALHQRPELARLDALAQALTAKSTGTRADVLPQVVAGISYGYLQNKTLAPNDVAQETVGMTWTPFDGISRAHATAMERESIAVSQMREEMGSVITLQVQKAWNDGQAARHKIDVAREAVRQADENLKLVSGQFKEGVATYTEVLDAQSLWTASHNNLYNVYYNAILAYYTLEYAVGNI
ncbi:MAG: TolC family protein [Thermoguttaceae bacterium]|nr:TolC family protein [Thermoguttaceae bacterium]